MASTVRRVYKPRTAPAWHLSEEAIGRITAANRGLYWVNDGTVSKRIRGELPEGWQRGRAENYKAKMRKIMSSTTS